MWLWILTGLNIIMNVHGFASGGVLVACGSMVPQHSSYKADETTPPFYISYQEGNEGGPLIVSLQGNNSDEFIGFMLEAREEGGPSVGHFTPIDLKETRLLDCNGVRASAVSHRNNQEKTSFRVQWTAPETRINKKISFRATFVQTFKTFWVNVTLPLKPPSIPTTITTNTEPITAASTTAAVMTTSVKPTLRTFEYKKQATELMVINSVFVVLKMAMSSMITVTVNNSILSRRLNRMSKIICCMLCLAVEISSMVLLIVFESSQVTLIALLSVVIIVNVLVLVLASLPIGPSHELKEMCNSAASVCSVILQIFAIAFIYVGYSALEEDGKNKKHPWPQLIAYTVWIFLFVVWVLVFTILQGRKKGSSVNRMQHNRQKKEKMLHKAGVIVTAVFIIVSIALAIALIVRILQHPEK